MHTDIESIRNYCLSKKETNESFPFDVNTLVFKVSDKMFALIGLSREPYSINLKCNPDRAVELRESYPKSILPGYHMSKKHWNTIVINELEHAKLLYELIDHSYDLVIKSMTKKQRTALGF